MLADQILDHGLGGRVQHIIGGPHVGELRVAALWGNDMPT